MIELTIFGVFFDVLEDCFRVCKGAHAAELRGRRHSGFDGAGRHEASYLYGYAHALVAAAGGDPGGVPDFRTIRSQAELAAREEFVGAIREGEDPFRPLTPKRAAT